MKTKPTHRSAAGDTYLAIQKKARVERRPTDEFLQLHALESCLDRLSTSPVAPQLVLKGGVLLSAYGVRRMTRDIDLSATRLNNDPRTMVDTLNQILAQPRGDGWVFGEPTHEQIREADAYSGSRLTVPCSLASARLRLQVDVNFGDPVHPPPELVRVPRLLGGFIEVAGYPIVMIHAEKLVTMLQREVATTRWRDFADVLLLSESHDLVGRELLGAVKVVARFRSIELSPLSRALAGLAQVAQTRWSVWVRKQGMAARLPLALSDVLDAIQRFADPVFDRSVESAHWDHRVRRWTPFSDSPDSRAQR